MTRRLLPRRVEKIVDCLFAGDERAAIGQQSDSRRATQCAQGYHIGKAELELQAEREAGTALRGPTAEKKDAS